MMISGGRMSKCDNFHVIPKLEGHNSEVKGLAWNNKGSILGSCSRDKMIWLGECYLLGTVGDGNGGGGGGGGVVVGDVNMVEDGEFKCQGHDGYVKCIAFGPSHLQFRNCWEVLYTASYDDTARVWAEDNNEWYCVMTLDTLVHSLTVMCLGLSLGGIQMYS